MCQLNKSCDGCRLCYDIAWAFGRSEEVDAIIAKAVKGLDDRGRKFTINLPNMEVDDR